MDYMLIILLEYAILAQLIALLVMKLNEQNAGMELILNQESVSLLVASSFA
jgi:hypothetical protein